MRLFIVLVFALLTIFRSLFGLRRCEGSERPPDARAEPTSGIVSR